MKNLSLLCSCVYIEILRLFVDYFKLVITSARNEQRKINHSVVLAVLQVMLKSCYSYCCIGLVSKCRASKHIEIVNCRPVKSSGQFNVFWTVHHSINLYQSPT